MIVYLHPFRIVDGPESPKWEVSINQINSGSWDFTALHEMVGGIDVGLKQPYHLVVSRDGGLALPLIEELTDDQSAIQFFNKCLAAMYIGGIFCEAVTLDCLDFGSIIDWKYLRVRTSASAAPNRFHNLVRLRRASTLEAIALEEPRIITIQELERAYQIGQQVLTKTPKIVGEFLLRGVGGLARRDWGVALSNLWITIEQLTYHLWKNLVVEKAKKSGEIEGRNDLLSDQRTWTISVKHEVLFQLGVFSAEVYSELSKARKARNRLSHNGTLPNEAVVGSAYTAVKALFKVILGDVCIPFVDIDLSAHRISNPFEPQDRKILTPKYWMRIDKLPGEKELEKLEAEARNIQKKVTKN